MEFTKFPFQATYSSPLVRSRNDKDIDYGTLMYRQPDSSFALLFSTQTKKKKFIYNIFHRSTKYRFPPRTLVLACVYKYVYVWQQQQHSCTKATAFLQTVIPQPSKARNCGNLQMYMA